MTAVFKADTAREGRVKIMTENNQDLNSEQTNLQDKSKETSTDTIPTDFEGITVPIKFNKEMINLNLQDAANLAQKGKKFEAIANELSRLRRIAGANGQSVTDFINTLEGQQVEKRKEELLIECGGNEVAVERILKLESEAQGEEVSLEEIKSFFPNIKKLSDLPESVVERAKSLGSNLLNEYLRYREQQRLQSRENESAAKKAQSNSIGAMGGSLSVADSDVAHSEFIKGIWGR